MAKYQQYNEYKDSGVVSIGLVPKNWSVSRLKQVVDQNRQVTYGIVQAGPNVKEGVYYIRPADMTEETGVKNYENLLKTSPEIAASYERSKVKAGDIICSIGPSFGKLMITPEYLDGANLTQGTARVAISSEYNTGYFFWALRSTCSFQQWESSVGGATFRALNLGPLADTFLVIPTNGEQTQIANFLDHETAQIDTLIEKQQTLIQLLKEKRQAVISHAVTKGLNPDAPMKDSGVEWLGEVPEHWSIPQIGYHSKVTKLTGFEYTNLWRPSIEGSIIALRGFNIQERYLDLSKTEKITEQLSNKLERSKLHEGDIVLPCTGTLGNAALIQESNLYHINQNIAKVSIDKKLFKPEFAVLWMTSLPFRQMIDFNNTSGMQPVLLIGDIRKLPIPLAPLYEQQEIVDFLLLKTEQFDRLIDSAELAIQLMQERRTALISAAVTGKIDVRGWRASE